MLAQLFFLSFSLKRNAPNNRDEIVLNTSPLALLLDLILISTLWHFSSSCVCRCGYVMAHAALSDPGPTYVLAHSLTHDPSHGIRPYVMGKGYFWGCRWAAVVAEIHRNVVFLTACTRRQRTVVACWGATNMF